MHNLDQFPMNRRQFVNFDILFHPDVKRQRGSSASMRSLVCELLLLCRYLSGDWPWYCHVAGAVRPLKKPAHFNTFVTTLC